MFDKLFAPVSAFFVSFFTRDVAAIVALIAKVEARLEAFLAAHRDTVAELEDEIVKVRERAEWTIAEISTNIAERNAQAAKVEALKAALPTSAG